MTKKKSVRSLTRLGLLAAALPMGAAQAAQPDSAELELHEVVVTGSRLNQASGGDTPHPIVTLDAQRIGQSGLTNLAEFLVQVPALAASETLSDTSGFGVGIGRAGLNLLNLRNLGTDRTLVLVNGRRHIAGEVGSAAVDINSLPMDLIERVDVLTGGVSAIYGADGVSGVVNFVTRRDFEGLSIRGQSGLAELGDAGSSLVSLTAGQNFAGGAGNVALAYEFGQNARVRGTDRARVGDPRYSFTLVPNPDDPNDDPALYDYVPMNDVRWADSSRDGAFDVDGDFFPDFAGSGTPFDPGIAVGEGLVIGGSSTPIAGYDGDLRARTQRHVVNLLGSYEVSRALRAFGEAKLARSRTWNDTQPSFDFFTYISEENPLIPDTLRDAIVPGGVSGWFDEPVADGVLMTRDNFDLGQRSDRVTRDTLRGVVGIDGRLAGNSRYELSYTFGQTDIEYFEGRSRVEERYFAALDAVDEGQFLNGTPNGVARCRIDLQPAGTVINYENILWESYFPGGDGSGTPQTFTPGPDSGCIPLNVFGDGVADPAAVAWITTDSVTDAKMSHHVVAGSLSGDTQDLFELPGGPLAWAVGAEFRKEKSLSVPGEMVQQELIFGYPLVLTERGSFDVREVFAEVRLPLARDLPLAKSLSVGGAVRLADYSTVGNATTWKLDTIWAPVDSMVVRGTYSEAVRAPNIGELFMPTGGTFQRISDPCDINFRNLGPSPANRQANCAQLLTELGLNPDTFQPSAIPQGTGSIAGSIGGNGDLEQETAKSWTAGLVLRPRFAPGLDISFDWYRTRLNSAITTVTAAELVELCVDAPSLDNSFCESITRNAAPVTDQTAGFINGFFLSPQNVSRFTVSGADLTLDYRFAPVPEWGQFNFRLTGGYLDELTFISTPGAAVESDRGKPYAPKFITTSDLTWSKGPWDVNLGTSHFSKTRRIDRETMAAEPDYVAPQHLWFKASWVHDLQVAYTLRDRGVRFYGGANNLFDAGADFMDGSYPNGWLGRFFYAGVNVNLNVR